jgi:hypothetical protein
MIDSLEVSLAVNPTVVTRTMVDGAILMNAMNGDCYELNALGATVWEQIGRGVPLKGIVAALVERYDVGESKLGADVLRLVDDLAQHGIVTLEGK